MSGEITIAEAIALGKLAVTGDRAPADLLGALFRLPPPVAQAVLG
jgi:hypothetical protein